MSTAYSSKRATTGKSRGRSVEMSIREERGARTKSILTYQTCSFYLRWGVVEEESGVILLSGGLAMMSPRLGP